MSEGAERPPRRDGMIRVFLLDDHEVVRRGVRDLLDAEPDITVVGEAGTAAAALVAVPALMPDVAVLDVRLPDGDGVSVCRDIRSQVPTVGCLMLTSFADPQALLASVLAGAAGYVLKQIRGADLVGAVRTAAAGQSLLDPGAAGKVIRRIRERAEHANPLAVLTAQEKRVLELVGEGLTNKQIGARLGLTEKTVKNYMSVLFAKLGIHRRTQAAVLATRISSAMQPGNGQGPPSSQHLGPQEDPGYAGGLLLGRTRLVAEGDDGRKPVWGGGGRQ